MVVPKDSPGCHPHERQSRAVARHIPVPVDVRDLSRGLLEQIYQVKEAGIALPPHLVVAGSRHKRKSPIMAKWVEPELLTSLTTDMDDAELGLLFSALQRSS